ncbi:hypothetical protein VN97_g12228 [Penicillium thymicola]|uniref:Uncharacterized protein n=1 Tax=Penicillium thymicola TaxID=293382 RepID=A0AAI9T6E2_PENTH|nr:hypothetical protein VN97_g12228 [Penicillium thymicola]
MCDKSLYSTCRNWCHHLHTLFDSFSNTSCQDKLVYIGSFSGVSLSVGHVLFLTQSNRVIWRGVFTCTYDTLISYTSPSKTIVHWYLQKSTTSGDTRMAPNLIHSNHELVYDKIGSG